MIDLDDIHIMDLFEGLSGSQGIAIVIVTHDPSVSRRCRRRTRMRAGVLTEEGNVVHAP